MPRTAVVALGGNAFTRAGQTGTHAELAANARTMADSVLNLRRHGWNVVVVHGNGPQVGNLAIQQDEGRGLVPAQPLFSLGAMTQGQLGSLLCLALRARVPDIEVAAVVTHAVVASDDPAFAVPTKPIGPFYSRARAEQLSTERGWVVTEDSGRGFRRVVASPHPVDVVETAAIRTLAAAGTIVVAGGGGGVPVVTREDGLLGVEAVIDKDYVAGRLATALSAQALVFVTDVGRVLLDFGRSTERAVDEIDVDQAERYHQDGQFPEGSMGPKILAATRFLRSGGEVVVVSRPEFAAGTLEPPVPGPARGAGGSERSGTRIVPARQASRVAS
jgi:carbamate kinase